MAKFIQTRNYRQCKMYHQKQSSQFENICDLIENLLKNEPVLMNELEKERKAYEMFMESETEKNVGIKEKQLAKTGLTYDPEEVSLPKQSMNPQINSQLGFFPPVVQPQGQFGFYGFQQQPMQRVKKPTQ